MARSGRPEQFPQNSSKTHRAKVIINYNDHDGAVFEAKVRRIGSSLGVLLPKQRLDDLGVKEGDMVRIPRLAPQSRRELYGVWKNRPVRQEFQEE